ncbi:MAG: hypothetical protein M5U22_19850 [Thermoleophilia bacterium]|nr:hypothetical protein [Thermoleophilia bacterium]
MEIFAFLGTRRGRLFRGTVGAALGVASVLWLRGWVRLLLAGFGFSEVVGGIWNLCAIAPLFGGHFFACRNVEEYGGERYRSEL